MMEQSNYLKLGGLSMNHIDNQLNDYNILTLYLFLLPYIFFGLMSVGRNY